MGRLVGSGMGRIMSNQWADGRMSLTSQHTDDQELAEVSRTQGLKASSLESPGEQHSQLQLVGRTPPILLGLLLRGACTRVDTRLR